MGNNKLEIFLEAISSYAEDIQGYYDNMKTGVNADVPAWQTFADIFKGATMYEEGEFGSFVSRPVLRQT